MKVKPGRSVALCALALNLIGLTRGSSMFDDFWTSVRFILRHPALTYDDKMALKFPEIYPSIRFIAAHTDAHASVLIPPALNQGALTSYLLYPRQVDSHREDSLWGRTPIGTFAYVEGVWPASVVPEIRAMSELVVSDGRRLLIRRVRDD